MVSVEGGSLARHADGTLTVLDDGGTPVGGLGAPRVVGRHGAPGADGADGASGASEASEAESGAVDGADADPTAGAPRPGPRASGSRSSTPTAQRWRS